MTPNDLFRFVSLRPAELGESTPGENSPIARRIRDVRRHHAAVLPTLSEVPATDRTKRITAVKRRQAELVRLINTHEKLQRVVHDAYVSAAGSPAMGRVSRAAGGRLEVMERGASAPAAALTWEALSSLVEARLGNESERNVFRTVLERLPPDIGVNPDTLIDGLAIHPLVDEANALCRELKALEDATTHELPTAPPASAAPAQPIVSAIGWGDLVVARESLVGYVAREIAHVENIMPGESKVREHERIEKTEQVEELETITETESEKDSQTTDRYELQAETQTTIQQNFSIQAGVNTSGRYGLTKVDTSLDTSFQQNRAQSQSSSIGVAREVIIVFPIERLTLPETGNPLGIG